MTIGTFYLMLEPVISFLGSIILRLTAVKGPRAASEYCRKPPAPSPQVSDIFQSELSG
jgi:hypothetical protein